MMEQYLFYDPPRADGEFSKLYRLETKQKIIIKKQLDIILESILLIKKTKYMKQNLDLTPN